jgi:predicted DNA-binding protein
MFVLPTPQAHYRQFPLRLQIDIADELDRVSKETRITKTELSRIAIAKFLNELKESGARAAIGKACQL